MVPSDLAWRVIAALQREADSPTIDRSLAREEAFDVVLAETVVNPNPNPDKISKRFQSLCRNRQNKHAHRRQLEMESFRPTHRRGGTDFGHVTLTRPAPTVLNNLITDQLMLLIRAELSQEEFAILMEIADGDSYGDIACSRGLTVTSLKSRVLRARNKVRNSSNAALFRRGLQH